MRVTAGEFKGRRIEAPETDEIRPTSDRVRQAMFNMLGSRGTPKANTVVIDCFCGTGALGIEALSRGAKFCLFTDKSRES